MYGFPLTIYVLMSVLPVDIPLTHFSGHLWATLLGYGVGGALVEMAIGRRFRRCCSRGAAHGGGRDPGTQQ